MEFPRRPNANAAFFPLHNLIQVHTAFPPHENVLTELNERLSVNCESVNGTMMQE